MGEEPRIRRRRQGRGRKGKERKRRRTAKKENSNFKNKNLTICSHCCIIEFKRLYLEFGADAIFGMMAGRLIWVRRILVLMMSHISFRADLHRKCCTVSC